MNRNLKPNDRVRVTEGNRVSGYQPGDKGAVLREIVSTSHGALYYLVAMDKDEPAKSGVVFRFDEIEADDYLRRPVPWYGRMARGRRRGLHPNSVDVS
jgi:hypothetical protein